MSTPRFTGSIDLHSLQSATTPSATHAIMACHDGNLYREGASACLISGTPRFADEADQALLRRDGAAAAFLQLWRRHGDQVLSHIQGGFALVAVDAERRQVLLAVDRFAVQTLCFARQGPLLHFSDRADVVAAATDRSLDPQALFDYLYFHMIPAPRTIFRAVQRLAMGQALLFEAAGDRPFQHMSLAFVENRHPPFNTERERFMAILRRGVGQELAGQAKVGAFLSGGTDSSTVAGLLCQATGSAAPTYSIGFEAAGYDEMSYARLAAKHFGCAHHEYYVTPDDLERSIPAVAQFHDQPFGNSSALPAYYCAKMAKDDGCSHLLAGDGGDELFGGNTRYGMQSFLQHYHRLPAGLRQAIEPYCIEPFCTETSPLRRIPGLRQATGYVRHARLAMPDRLQTSNLLTVLGPAQVLTEGLLSAIDLQAPAHHMRATWAACQAGSVLNRMLAYDWRYTLADSDLPKVRGAAAMAGISVGYPLLGDELADFSMSLPPDWKLRRFKLRWFFKEALRGFLPDEIISKKKHGFGLPFGTWVGCHTGLGRLVQRSLGQLGERGIVRQDFVRKLLDEHLPAHPGYYGEMVWLLLTLEQWLDKHAPDFKLPRG